MPFNFYILYFSKIATSELRNFNFNYSSFERTKALSNFENNNIKQDRPTQIDNFGKIYSMSQKKYNNIAKITKRSESKPKILNNSFYKYAKKRVLRSINANNESDSFVNTQNITDIETPLHSVNNFRHNDAYDASDPFVRLTSSIVQNFDTGKHIQIDAIQSDLSSNILTKFFEIKTNEDYNQTTSDLLKQDMDAKYFNDFSDFNIEDGKIQKMTFFNVTDPHNFDMNSSIQKANGFLTSYIQQVKKQRRMHEDPNDAFDITTISSEYEKERRLKAIRIIAENSEDKRKQNNSETIDIISRKSRRYINDTEEYKNKKQNTTNVATRRNITDVNSMKTLPENHYGSIYDELHNKNIGIYDSLNDELISNGSKIYNSTIENVKNISMNMTLLNTILESKKDNLKPDSQLKKSKKDQTNNSNVDLSLISFIQYFSGMLLNEKYEDLLKENETTSNKSFIKTQENIENDCISEKTNFDKDYSEVVSLQKNESNLKLNDENKDNYKFEVREKYVVTEEVPNYGNFYDSYDIIN